MVWNVTGKLKIENTRIEEVCHQRYYRTAHIERVGAYGMVHHKNTGRAADKTKIMDPLTADTSKVEP